MMGDVFADLYYLVSRVKEQKIFVAAFKRLKLTRLKVKENIFHFSSYAFGITGIQKSYSTYLTNISINLNIYHKIYFSN